jgi:hypothetical protein
MHLMLLLRPPSSVSAPQILQRQHYDVLIVQPLREANEGKLLRCTPPVLVGLGLGPRSNKIRPADCQQQSSDVLVLCSVLRKYIWSM